jgi:hypothetical protein
MPDKVVAFSFWDCCFLLAYQHLITSKLVNITYKMAIFHYYIWLDFLSRCKAQRVLLIYQYWGGSLEIHQERLEGVFKTLNLRWVTAPRLVFDMMCSVGIKPLRKRFQSCLALLALGMLLWLIIFYSLIVPHSGRSILLEWHMIGSWISFWHFLINCIPSNWEKTG